MGPHPQPTASSAVLRATLSGDGLVGPIEARIGRRLVRLLDPRSEEGRSLLGSAKVQLVGPDGESLGRLRPAEAYRVLRERLERRLAEADADRAALREGLDRLRVRAERTGHA